ncbi:MAG TPA: DUF4956 domain-containing protein [Saccharofermentans sp.]|nr:DUF4956 domain-containing protein [Saccharofermentans sp.]HPE27318.1 DUF4956 domain-containing protein [Saccharofermentans sp.]
MLDFIIPVVAALVLGFVQVLVHMFKNRYSKSFVATLAILPAIVCVVIMAVDGNIGAGVAVAGAFSLVRFRSAPGTAKEIGSLFMAMATGILTGTGSTLYAVAFTLIISAVVLVYQAMDFGRTKNEGLHRNLRITIPEDLDYTGVFDEVFEEYAKDYRLLSSRTSNMGSMFRLTYDVTLRDLSIEKEFIDKLRCRNGNLEISISALMERETAEL